MALRVTCSIALLVTLVLCQATLGRIVGSKRNATSHRLEARDVLRKRTPESPGSDDEPTDDNVRERLMRHLYENGFDRESNPLTNGQKLTVGLRYICARFDEDQHVLKSRVWQRFSWTDSRMQWDPAHFNGISQLNLYSWFIWTPDVTLFNAVEPVEYEWVNAIVFSTGQVLYVPPATYTTVCRPESTGSGHGRHRCNLELGSWTYDSVELPLQMEGEGFLTNAYNPDCPYTVSQSHASIASAKYETSEWQTLNMTFTIQKNDYHY